MKLWHVYVRKGTLFIPAMAKTEAGFYMDVEPVIVVESANRPAILSGLKTTISQGNPVIPTPSRDTFPKPVVLSHAKVKSWAAFAKIACCWIISAEDSRYQLRKQRRSPSGGWEDDPLHIQVFDPPAGIDDLANALADQIAAAESV